MPNVGEAPEANNTGREVERVTISEAATLLNVHPNTVRNRVKAGIYRAEKCITERGPTWMIDRDSLTTNTLANDSQQLLNRVREETFKQSAPDHGVVLHYIDKLFAANNALSTTSKRSGQVATVLSLILLGLSGGALSAQEKITFQGVGLRVPLAVFLTGGAVAVSVFVVVRVGANVQTTGLRLEITRLYRALGFEDRTLYGYAIHPFGSRDALGILLTLFRAEDYSFDLRTLGRPRPPSQRMGRLIGALLVAVLILVLPIAAQAAVGVQASELLRQRGLGWVWIFFILLAAGSTCGVMVSFWRLASTLSVNFRTRWLRLGRSQKIIVFVTVTGFPIIVILLGAGIGLFVAKVLGSN
jgi:hypothetical protein